MADNFWATIYLSLEMFHEKEKKRPSSLTQLKRWAYSNMVAEQHSSSIFFLFHLNTLYSLRTRAIKFEVKMSVPQKGELEDPSFFVLQPKLTLFWTPIWFFISRKYFSYKSKFIHQLAVKLIWYCMDRVSFCNISVIQQDTQYLMINFIHNIH